MILEPPLEASLLTSRLVVQILIVGSCHGFISQVAPYFSNTQGFTDAQGGLITIPSSVGNALGNLIAGQIIKRHAKSTSPPNGFWLTSFRNGSYKKLSVVSLVVCIATAVLILFQWSHTISTYSCPSLSSFVLAFPSRIK